MNKFTFEPLAVPDLIVIKPTVHGDARGFFLETRIKAVFSPWAMGGLFSLIAILIDGLAEPNVFTYRVDALLWMVIGIGYALYNAHGKPLVTQSMQEE